VRKWDRNANLDFIALFFSLSFYVLLLNFICKIFSKGRAMESQKLLKPNNNLQSFRSMPSSQSVTPTTPLIPTKLGNLSREAILQLQRTHGNRRVAQLLNRGNTLSRTPYLQREVRYTKDSTSTKHPPLSLDQKPYTMLVIGKAGVSLQSDSFASCVGVTFLDTTNGWGAIAHFWAGKGTGDEVESELDAVVNKIKNEGFTVNKETLEISLHVGVNSEHLFSTRRAEKLRAILNQYGQVGTETSGASVSIQVPSSD
jgi:hypothetical protein